MKRKKTNSISRVWRSLHSYFKLALWPHKANQHHPHAVRWYGLVLVVAVVVVCQGAYSYGQSSSVLGVRTNLTAEQLLQETNTERSKLRLVALELNEKLNQAAALKAEDMLQNQYWAHVAPSGTMPWDWITKAGYEYDYAGENLAKNFSSAQAVTTAWMASPEHQANILGAQYSDVGFAVAEGELNNEPITLVVALYGHELPIGSLAAATHSSTPVDQPLAPVTRLGVVVRSLPPVTLGLIAVLLFAAAIALVAHAYRKKLPKNMQRSWRRHHGLIKATGLLSLCVLLLLVYSGGQI